MRFGRACHRASKLVHVGDVYDAPRPNRPYREAWPQERTLAYLRDRAGVEFDPEMAGAFVRMMTQWEPQVAVMTDERAPLGTAGATSTPPRAACPAPAIRRCSPLRPPPPPP